MGDKIILIGSGGHAKVIADLIYAQDQFEIHGVVSKSSSANEVRFPYLGDDLILPSLYDQGLRYAFPAIGDNRIRLRVAQKLVELGFILPSLIGKTAFISPSAQLGKGVAVMEGVVINADTRIGDFCIINTHASLDHDVTLDEAVHVAPGSTLAGNVNVGRLSFLGAGVTVIPEIQIASEIVVGAGATVVQHILKNGGTYVGLPARLITHRSDS